jgi:lysophospholipase L1-like esterase
MGENVLQTLFARIACALGFLVFVPAALGAQTVSVLPMGDSITRGFGSNDEAGYRGPLYRRLASVGWNPNFVGSLSTGYFPQPNHEGHDGVTIRQLAGRFERQHRGPTGQVTLLMVGTNDIWQGTGADSGTHAPENLNRLIETIFEKNYGTRLFVASIPRIWDGNTGEELQAVREYNSAIPGIVATWASRGKAIHFVDVYSKLQVSDLHDGVHPNDDGYRKIANAFFDAMVTVPEPGSAGLLLVTAIAATLRRRR